MNEYQIELFYNLQKLVNENEAFFCNVFKLGTRHYAIFNYRIASYSDFLLPSALEARGIMFEVAWAVSEDPRHDVDMTNIDFLAPVRLVSMPPSKFFNYKENPFTMDIDLDRVVSIHDKADGSLISSYLHDEEEVRLKSKGSLFSNQVQQAEQFLFKDLNKWDLAEDVIRLTELGFTVNMEWCAPENRIVLGYQTPSLKVFSVRNNFDGTELDRDIIRDEYNCQMIYNNWVDEYVVDDIPTFIEQLPEMKEIEGVVLTMDDNQKIKMKTNWYLARHHTKDSINTPRRLFEAVIEEASDDMKSLFWHDQAAIDQIEKMEQFVEHKYNHLVDSVERFYHANKDLDRKSYAIKGQQELDKMMFGLAMKKYIGQDINYKSFLKSQWKKLGLKDEKESFDE